MAPNTLGKRRRSVGVCVLALARFVLRSLLRPGAVFRIHLVLLGDETAHQQTQNLRYAQNCSVTYRSRWNTTCILKTSLRDLQVGSRTEVLIRKLPGGYSCVILNFAFSQVGNSHGEGGGSSGWLDGDFSFRERGRRFGNCS